MTMPDESGKSSSKITKGPWPSPLPVGRGKGIIAWFRDYGMVILVVGAVGALLWHTTSSRFDDIASRVDDTKTEVRAVETRISDQIRDVKVEVGKAEERLGDRLDHVRGDMNALRQDMQGLRQDIWSLRDQTGPHE